MACWSTAWARCSTASRRSTPWRPGGYIREHFFGADPRLLALVDGPARTTRSRRSAAAATTTASCTRRTIAAVSHRGEPDRDPRPDREGLDAGHGRRGAQHHAPGEEALRAGAEGLPRPAGAAHPGRQAQGRALLPPGPGRPRDPVPAGAPPRAGRSAAAARGHRQAARARRATRSSGSSRAGREARRSPPRWPSPSSSGTCCATRSSATASCPSSPTRRARSASTRCSRRSASTPPGGSSTSRSTPT